MRLTPQERSAILACAHRHFGAEAVVRLFGSRVDDAKKGGDIDLHIEVRDAPAARIDAELAFRTDLQDRIGEQRVDVIVRRIGYVPKAIDRIAVATGLRL